MRSERFNIIVAILSTADERGYRRAKRLAESLSSTEQHAVIDAFIAARKRIRIQAARLTVVEAA